MLGILKDGNRRKFQWPVGLGWARERQDCIVMGTSCYCPDPSHPPHASSFHTPRPRGHLTHSFHNDTHKSLFSAQVFRICSQAQHGPPLMKNDLVQNANNSGNPVEMQLHQPSLSLSPEAPPFSTEDGEALSLHEAQESAVASITAHCQCLPRLLEAKQSVFSLYHWNTVQGLRE